MCFFKKLVELREEIFAWWAGKLVFWTIKQNETNFDLNFFFSINTSMMANFKLST